jgi:hypothetical protein
MLVAACGRERRLYAEGHGSGCAVGKHPNSCEMQGAACVSGGHESSEATAMFFKFRHLTGGFARALIVASGISFLIPVANADTLFQSVPSFDDANVQFAICSTCLGENFSAFDQFTLGAASTISSIEVAIQYSAPTASNPSITGFTTTIFTLSGTPLFSQSFSNGEVNFISNIPNNASDFQDLVSVTPTGLSLPAGSYLISFFDNSINGLAPLAYTNGANLAFQTTSGTDDPTAPIEPQPPFSLGFVLEGNSAVGVPAPIVGSGLPGLIFASGGLLAWWRRKRKAQAVA